MPVKPGDLIRLKSAYAPYFGRDCLNMTLRKIDNMDICVWIGKDPDKRGKRTFPTVILGDRLIEVQGDAIFENVLEQR